MQACQIERRSVARREEGIALIVTLMVLMLVSALMVGFVSAIIADQRASGLAAIRHRRTLPHMRGSNS